jgi:hypothetical protein
MVSVVNVCAGAGAGTNTDTVTDIQTQAQHRRRHKRRYLLEEKIIAKKLRSNKNNTA